MTNYCILINYKCFETNNVAFYKYESHFFFTTLNSKIVSYIVFIKIFIIEINFVLLRTIVFLNIYLR